MKGIALFGGTFNPFHNGHLAILHYLDTFSLIDTVFMIPNRQAPHKESSPLLLEGDNVVDDDKFNHYRLSMLELVCERESPSLNRVNLQLSHVEMERTGPSWMIDTVMFYQNEYPGIPLFLVIGSDSFFNFHTWRLYRNILEKCQLIVVKREDKAHTLSQEAYHSYFDRYLSFSKWENIHLLSNKILEISSSDIRRQLIEGLSISDLVPHYIEEFLQKGTYHA